MFPIFVQIRQDFFERLIRRLINSLKKDNSQDKLFVDAAE